VKSTLFILAVVTAISLTACGGGKQEAKQNKSLTQVVYYGCPMSDHAHNAAKEPGECPECGVPMVAVVRTTDGEHDFYGCPMAEHSHIRSDEPGTCPECGMTYRPLKFDI